MMLPNTTNQQMVYQDNQLIEACYHLTLNEKRLVLLAITKIDRSQKPRADLPNRFVITASEWAEAYPQKNPYMELKRAVAELYERSIQLRAGNGIKRGRMRWITSELEYEDSSVSLTFTHEVSLYLQGMVDSFTKFDLVNIKALTSTYSIRLYELLKQWSSTGMRLETIDNLRFSLNAVDAYPRWADFNRYVIKKAVIEVSEKTNLKVKYETIKKGREVTAIKFYFVEEKQVDMFKT